MHKLCVRQRVCTVQHNSSVRNTMRYVQHNSSVRQRISIVQHNGPLRQRTPDVQYRVYQRPCMSNVSISCIRWHFISNFMFNNTNMQIVCRGRELQTGWEWLILGCGVNSSCHKYWRKDSCLQIECSWISRLAGITMRASGVPYLIISTLCSKCWSIIACWNVNKPSTWPLNLLTPTHAQLNFIRNHLKTPTCFGLRPSSGSYHILAKVTII